MLNPNCLKRPFNSPTERAKRIALQKEQKSAYRKYADLNQDKTWFQVEASEYSEGWQHLDD